MKNNVKLRARQKKECPSHLAMQEKLRCVAFKSTAGVMLSHRVKRGGCRMPFQSPSFNYHDAKWLASGKRNS